MPIFNITIELSTCIEDVMKVMLVRNRSCCTVAEHSRGQWAERVGRVLLEKRSQIRVLGALTAVAVFRWSLEIHELQFNWDDYRQSRSTICHGGWSEKTYHQLTPDSQHQQAYPLPTVTYSSHHRQRVDSYDQ